MFIQIYVIVILIILFKVHHHDRKVKNIEKFSPKGDFHRLVTSGEYMRMRERKKKEMPKRKKKG